MLFYNCSVFIYSTVAGRKCEINIIVNCHHFNCQNSWWLCVEGYTNSRRTSARERCRRLLYRALAAQL